ncbi:hypothetical protein PR048_000437 [Dryococelus australis]|uniref:Uncharacterized protein n=1 Tax=Dryococelus australis TaxID=614101 RepID=A0ABQ9IEL6_9NEOP|nr:hypothetical protein PR048_000437 [Dryococelus australis]
MGSTKRSVIFVDADPGDGQRDVLLRATADILQARSPESCDVRKPRGGIYVNTSELSTFHSTSAHRSWENINYHYYEGGQVSVTDLDIEQGRETVWKKIRDCLDENPQFRGDVRDLDSPCALALVALITVTLLGLGHAQCGGVESVELRRNAKAEETGDPRENPPTSGTVRHDRGGESNPCCVNSLTDILSIDYRKCKKQREFCATTLATLKVQTTDDLSISRLNHRQPTEKTTYRPFTLKKKVYLLAPTVLLRAAAGADSAAPRRNRRPTSHSPLHGTMRSRPPDSLFWESRECRQRRDLLASQTSSRLLEFPVRLATTQECSGETGWRLSPPRRIARRLRVFDGGRLASVRERTEVWTTTGDCGTTASEVFVT